MSKYKVSFSVNSNANFRSTNAQVIDLVDDYGYTEEKAEEIIKDESFSSLTFEETAKHVLKECVISNYFDMTEMEE